MSQCGKHYWWTCLAEVKTVKQSIQGESGVPVDFMQNVVIMTDNCFTINVSVAEQLLHHAVYSDLLHHHCRLMGRFKNWLSSRGLHWLTKLKAKASVNNWKRHRERSTHYFRNCLEVSRILYFWLTVNVFSLQLALRNALRYFPPSHHETLAPEFAQELRQYGHIYMYRFCPSLRMRWENLSMMVQPVWDFSGPLFTLTFESKTKHF